MTILIAIMSGIAVISAASATMAHARHQDYLALWIWCLGVVCPIAINVAAVIHKEWKKDADSHKPTEFLSVPPTGQQPLDANVGIAGKHLADVPNASSETQHDAQTTALSVLPAGQQPVDHNLGMAPQKASESAPAAPTNPDGIGSSPEDLPHQTLKKVFQRINIEKDFNAQERIRKAYKEVDVSWDLILGESSENSGKTSIHLHDPNDMDVKNTAIVELDLPRQNNLLRLYPGSKLHVVGVIDRIYLWLVYLKDVTLTPVVE